MILIPFQPSVPSYRMSVAIEATNFVLDVYYNERDSAWYFDLLDSEESPIISGVKVVLGTPLLRTVDERAPGGVWIAHDTTNSGVEAGLDDLGGRVVVEYYTEAEARAL